MYNTWPLRDGKGVLSTRMYTGWSTPWVGVSKNLVDMLGGSLAAVLTAAVAVRLAWAAWVIPLADSAACVLCVRMVFGAGAR